MEGTLCQAVRVADARHSRYVGLARTHLQQLITAVALNILRALAWLDKTPPERTRMSRWRTLAAAM